MAAVFLTGKPDERDVVERGDQLVSDHGVDGQARFGGELVIVDRGERVGQVGHVDFGQESELAQVHPEDGDRCRSASRMARSIVPSPPRLTSRSARFPELGGGHRLGGAGQPADLGVDAEDLDIPAGRPFQDRPDGPAAVPLRVQHHPTTCMGSSY
jgi:hypothetical protein